MKKMKCERGTATLEACIVVPAFVMLMLLVNGLFILFMGQQIMTHAAVQSAKSLALDPYASGRVAANETDKLADMLVDLFTIGDGEYVSTDKWYSDDIDDLEETVEERFFAYITSDENRVDDILDMIGIEGGKDGIRFDECSVDDDVLTMKICYTQNFIFRGDLTSFDQELVLKVKLFKYE